VDVAGIMPTIQSAAMSGHNTDHQSVVVVVVLVL